MVDSELHERFQNALLQRDELNIDKRLSAADAVWNDAIDNTNDCDRHDGNNHIKKKVWTLYSILLNQFKADGDEATYLEPLDPEIEEISEHIAEELMDDAVTATQAGNSEISLESFLTRIDVLTRKYTRMLSRIANKQLQEIAKNLRESMYSGENLEEIKKLLLDFCLYPNVFVVAAYKVEEEVRSFRKGRVKTCKEERYTFHRISPWNVFPCESRSSLSSCSEYFIIEDYCPAQLRDLLDNEGAKDSVINKILNNPKDYTDKWYRKECKKYPKIKTSDIPVVKFYGNTHKDSKEGKYEYGEIWQVCGETIFESSGKDDTARVFTASYRPSNDGIWGSGVVDIAHKMQATINKLSEMAIDNIGYRAKPSGFMDKDLMTQIVNQCSKDENGNPTIDYTKIYAVDGNFLSNRLPFRPFDVPDRTQQIQSTIDFKKRDIDSLLGIPAFADGSQNVGTIGRTFQGLFLAQSNLMNSIDSAWNHFADNILVRISEQVINGGFLDSKDDPILDFKVCVRPFYRKEEDLEDASALLQRVQAISQLSQTGYATPQQGQSMADEAIRKLGGTTNQESFEDEQTQVQPQLVDPSLTNQILE